MNIPFDSTLGHLPVPQVPVAASQRPLHRIADVRKRQGISVRSAARRMHTSIDQVRRQEEPGCDMLLSELLRWQQALEVPVGDLLVESEAPLSEPVLTRARLLRIMKTVRAIKETATSTSIQRFATMLEQQLVEVMPELKDVCRVAFDRPATFAQRIGADGRADVAGFVLRRLCVVVDAAGDGLILLSGPRRIETVPV